jgi:hypothetical protein
MLHRNGAYNVHKGIITLRPRFSLLYGCENKKCK